MNPEEFQLYSKNLTISYELLKKTLIDNRTLMQSQKKS